MKKLTPRQIFDKIEAMILEEPKRIRMEGFAYDPSQLPEDQLPACRTVGCIGGWAVAIGLNKIGKLHEVNKLGGKAQKLIDLDDLEAQRLFYKFPPGHWGTKEYADAVVAHMEEFRKDVPHLKRISGGRK